MQSRSRTRHTIQPSTTGSTIAHTVSPALDSRIYDCGVYRLFCLRGGGSYIDGGACQKIIDGKIKMKSGVGVERITARGVAFDDGSEINADVIVVATGFHDARVLIVRLLGEEAGAKVPPVWGLNAEGELRGPWRKLESLPGMWLMMGNFAWCRFYSTFALQIKVKQEWLHGSLCSFRAVEPVYR